MTRPARRHGWALAAVVGAVTLMHAWLGGSLLGHMAGLQPAERPGRLQADFVAEVRLQAPPAPPPLTAAPPQRSRRAAPPLPPPQAASAAEPASAPASAAPAASAPATQADPVRADAAAAAASAADERPLDEAQTTQAPTSADAPAQAASAFSTTQALPPASASASASAAEAEPANGDLLFGFPWPRSTRIRYALTGQYRGEVRGRAEVVWLREGTRYQVHVDTLVGPSFAPLFQRNISSDGVITPAGLAPRRYDEESKVAFSRRHRQVMLGEAEVVFTHGEREARWSGVQDLASQFVQLTYRFLREPALLAAGRTIELPVAMSKQQRLMVFDVLGEERLSTPLGEIPAVHLRPRMPPGAAGKLGGDLLVELWFAPQLEYLPVRLKIVKDEATYVDLMIDRLPQRAAPAQAASAAP